MNKEITKKIVLFDGVCNLCNSSVQFILKRDKKNQFLFGSLTGCGRPGNTCSNSIFLLIQLQLIYAGGRRYNVHPIYRGALRMLKHYRGPLVFAVCFYNCSKIYPRRRV